MDNFQFNTLFGSGNAYVANLPKNFDLTKSIEKADEIYLATAFAHMSGWNLIKDSVYKSKAYIKIITGFSFYQTEPYILEKWLNDSKKGNISVRINNVNVIFHPKVLLIKSKEDSFAIIGSGNLSSGGFINNIECAVYINDQNILNSLFPWFITLFDDCYPLNKKIINDYKKKYIKARPLKREIDKIKNNNEEPMIYTSDFIKDIKAFFKTKKFHIWNKERNLIITKIKKALHYPSFNFSQDDWDEFYGYPHLGYLLPIYRDRIFLKKEKLQDGFRYLINEAIPIEKRMYELLDNKGKYHIKGVGINIITKVLAIHDPKKYPVINKPVKDTLKRYNLPIPTGKDIYTKYFELSRVLQGFYKNTNAKNMYELDIFLYNSSTK